MFQDETENTNWSIILNVDHAYHHIVENNIFTSNNIWSVAAMAISLYLPAVIINIFQVNMFNIVVLFLPVHWLCNNEIGSVVQ